MYASWLTFIHNNYQFANHPFENEESIQYLWVFGMRIELQISQHPWNIDFNGWRKLPTGHLLLRYNNYVAFKLINFFTLLPNLVILLLSHYAYFVLNFLWIL